MRGNSGRGIVIQKRDRELLRGIGMLRVIDREQAKIVGGFTSTTRVNARLLALTRAGLLKRFFLGTTAGGAKALYSLSSKGAHLAGVHESGLPRRNGAGLVGDLFIEHQLAVNSVYCAFKQESAKTPGVSFRSWRAFSKPLTPNVSLIPDGYVECGTSSSVLAAFLEIDLGTESLRVWKEKVENYLRYAASDAYEKEFGETRFRVLVIANSERRLESIRAAVRAVTQKLFGFANFGVIREKGLFAPVWLRPTGEDRFPLIKELP
jgi:hypothetical protein